LLKAYRSMLSRAKFRPFIHNHVVDIDGDSAAGSCYLDLRATMGGESMIGAGCYNDRYVRLDGRWFFASRSLKLEFFVPLSRGWTSGEGTGGLPRPADD